MRVLEEPFTTRDSIIAVLRPGQPSTESPFRTLRRERCVSEGLRVGVRTRLGQFLGHTQLYCSLNADAARAVRLGEKDIAREFAVRAQQLECSPDAHLLRAAVQAVGAGMSADPTHVESPVSLRQYLQLRRRNALSVDDNAIAREWLAHSFAWREAGDRAGIESAIAALASRADEARADLLSTVPSHATVFYGIVRRMDELAAEVEGEDDVRLVPRRDLERQGLAILGQAVALTCEPFPAGGTLVLVSPAVALDQASMPAARSPLDLEGTRTGEVPINLIDREDREWIERGLARQPTAVPVAPIPRQ
jgi:hypothetical protein